MRVLGVGKFYPPEYYGGLETAVVTLNAELVRRGVAVTCVVSAVRGAGGASDVDGVRVVRARSLGTLFSQPLSPAFAAAVRGEAGDVVHLHHPNPLGDLAALGDRDRPLVVTQHSDVVRQRLLRPVYGPVIRRVFERARTIVATSAQYVTTSRELAGFEAKVRVIPNGIDGARFDSRPETEARAGDLRMAWGARERPVVLAVGRLVGYKGLDVLLEAVRRLDIVTVIVGTGPLEQKLRHLAGKDVIFAGRVDEQILPACYRACDVFCLPSVTIAEAFGVVLVEAMASGKPLVTTALPTGVSAVNRNGETGLVVPPGDSTALAEALRTLVSDEVRRAAMGRRAREVYEREYTSALMAERYLSVYREALG